MHEKCQYLSLIESNLYIRDDFKNNAYKNVKTLEIRNCKIYRMSINP